MKPVDLKRTSPFTDVNGLVGAFLDDVSERPGPRGAKTRISQIREAVASGNATVEMALDIIALFPKDSGLRPSLLR
jgi:hypothetical protein